jgi:peptide/nickel transport system substrate-binding protein
MRTDPFRAIGGLLLAAALCGATAACKPRAEGVVHVTVIGGTPKLADPERGPLDRPARVLVNNVAQGLVRFDARGQIEPGLAETWNVSDDGLSYIFRLAMRNWPDGRRITAEQVARNLRRLIGPGSRDPAKDSFGAVDDVVAMTDRVIEIRLAQPRPHLLQLLAQPEMGLVRDGQGTGPFAIDKAKSKSGSLRLTREVATPDEEQTTTEQLELSGAAARDAIKAFEAGSVDLLLGGTFVDLPNVRRANLPRRALQFDPALGLFGLVPANADGPLAKAEVRQLLSEAIDRDSLIAAFSVPGLVPRATVLEPALDNVPNPVPPAWTAMSPADRMAALVAAAQRLFPSGGKQPVIRVALPDGPGSSLLLERLVADWGRLGITVERVGLGDKADLKLVDEVAPSTSASWYLRKFRCPVAVICDPQVDELLEAARLTPVPAQRSALLAEASRQVDSLQLFIPIAAPIRWSLVSARITGFAGNRFAVHTLTGLEQKLDRTGE